MTNLMTELRSRLHGHSPPLHDGVTGKAKCVICGNFNRFWHIVDACNFCQSCVSEILAPSAGPPAIALAHSPDVRREVTGKGDVSDSQFAGILKAAESGDAVNTMDLINALWWRIGNQRRELKRKNARIEQLQNDCQELTCGDPRLVTSHEPGERLPASDRNTILDAMHYPREYLARWKGKGNSANAQHTLDRLQEMLERTQEPASREASPLPTVCRTCGSTDTMPWPQSPVKSGAGE